MTDTDCYLGLGSNLGDRAGNLARALELLGETAGVTLRKLSSVYETAPVGVTDQPRFLNMVALISCGLDPRELLRICKDIERRMGRPDTERWGPRNIDLDLLLCGDLTLTAEPPLIPHPLLAERQFVLIPLHEIAPDLVLPGGARVADLVRPGDDVVRLGSLDELTA